MAMVIGIRLSQADECKENYFAAKKIYFFLIISFWFGDRRAQKGEQMITCMMQGNSQYYINITMYDIYYAYLLKLFVYGTLSVQIYRSSRAS